MAKLYYRYGAMSSSKTANAIMVKHNYDERGQRALLVKPDVDMRDGVHTIGSRSGLSDTCVLFNELDLDAIKRHAYDCIIVDEAQFLNKEQVMLLTDLVDQYDVPVICYGLRADFSGKFFEGSQWLMAWADTIEEVKTICWCGRKAICNARLDGSNGITKVGEQVVLGANDKYISLCRKHWKLGDPGPQKA
ncbi:MAG: thymidine kinase [Christensenellaceae bacterium]|jgi:thymidine kinase|nr:thymidine kinase [Christensenellaceae bacterium]